MPILSVEGMLDAAEGLTHNSNNPGTPLPGTPYQIFASASGSFSVVTVSKDANGWLTTRTGPASGSTTAQAKYCGISRHLSDVTTFTSTSYVYGGARIKVNINATQLPIVTIHDRRAASLPNQNAHQLVIFSYLDIVGGVVSDKEYYFEWAIDMPNKVVHRRLDGVVLPDVAFATGTEAAFLAQALAICYGFSAGYMVAASTVVGYSIRDVYIGEKVVGETIDWLGPQIVAPIPLKSVTAPWTPSSGTLLEALNTRINDAASAVTPFVTTDAGATEAAIQFDSPNVAGKINAVQVNFSGRRTAVALGGVEAYVVDGSTESTKRMRLLDTTFSYAGTVFVANRSPSGAPWSKAKIDSIVLKLTPKN